MIKQLPKLAVEALEYSFAPYSNFHVGVAILCSDGEIIKAANVESSVSSVGMCAERIGLSLARMTKKIPRLMAIVSEHNGIIRHDVNSCGICRQMMVEFDLLHLLKNDKIISVKRLLPKAYEGRKPK